MGLSQSDTWRDNSQSGSSGGSQRQSRPDSERAGAKSTSSTSAKAPSSAPASNSALSPKKSSQRSTERIERIVVSPTNSDVYDYQQALSSLHDRKSKAVSISRDPEVVSADAVTQFRSTLALGQLITAKTPSAGSKMIAHELQALGSTLKQESAALRKEIASLPESMANSLKVALDEERDQRNAGALDRRPMFGRFPYRRFPVYRRPPRIALQFARKSVSNASTNTSPPRSSSPSGAAPRASTSRTSKSLVSPPQQQETAQKQAAVNLTTTKSTASAQDSSANPTQQQLQLQPQQQQQQQQQQQAKQAFSTVEIRLPPSSLGPILPNGTLFKTSWFPQNNSSSSYDGEPDTDSDSPGSTP